MLVAVPNLEYLQYRTYFVDVLALELLEELVETFILSFNADGFEDFLDLLSGRAGVATETEQEVCCEVLHFECCCTKSQSWLRAQ